MAVQTFEDVLKFNPYHDARGRFASANSASAFTYAPGKSKAHDNAIAREKERSAGEGTEKGFKGTLYHGSPATDIEEFNLDLAGSNTSSGERLLFFTDSKQMAEDFSYERLEGSTGVTNARGKKGRVYEVEVEIKNPLDFRNLSDTDIDNILQLDMDGLLTKDMVKQLSSNHQLLKTSLDLRAERLKALGYDGLIANTGKAGHNSTEYAVVSSKQAKITKGDSDTIYSFNSQTQKSMKDSRAVLFVGLQISGADSLTIDGGENPEDFHITLAYGTFDTHGHDEDDTAIRVRRAVDQVKVGIPDTIRFDAIGRFTASKSSEGKDVIYAQVAPGQLEEAHDFLLSMLKEEGIELEATFPDYKPHMTLAYIDPGTEYKLGKIDATGTTTQLLIGQGWDSSHENEYTITKIDEDKRLVFGWASVSITVDGEQVEDRQHDLIDPEDLEEAVYEYVLNFRDSGEEHISTLRKKGKLVESCVFTEEKQKAMGIPDGVLPIGWWIGFKIEDDAAWEKVKNGTYKMFSIEGKARREPVQKSVQDVHRVAKTFDQIIEIESREFP